ncbi:hypothetical protein [Maridesulfovibrio frigidus]|uniref:hypothetical protein n=1 Tax=Maridesulfovibrio frigidus TaxID=340956 RepID=UPI000A9369B1|nr:hypothetical protein [Maridesulfovibrio frigidus]
MTKTAVDFKIYDLLRIQGSNLPKHLVTALVNDYGHFMETDDTPATNLHLKPISQLELPPHLFQKRKNLMEQHYILEYKDKLYAVLLHRNKPDCLLTLQEPYTLYFTNRKKCASAVLDMLFTGVDIILRDTSNALLCKGAVVVQDGKAVVLTGISGAGKTSILMNLLHDGWSYLSDNTFILHKNRAMCFRRHLVMHHYHLKKFSDVYKETKPEKPIKKLFRQTLYRLLPHMPKILQSSQKINRLANPYIRVTPEDFRSEIDAVNIAPISHWICLTPADKYYSSVLLRKQLIDQLQSVLDLTHKVYHNFRRFSVLYNKYSLNQEHKILDDNIDSGTFYMISLSGTQDFNSQYLQLKNEISITKSISKTKSN